MDHTFTLTRFENRNGAISWRVSGWLHGIRIRRNLPTREEAAAEKLALELKALQAGAGLRPAISVLTDAQLREAEAVFGRLTGQPRSLSFYIDFALTNYREPQTSKLLSEATADYKAAKQHEREQDLISAMHLTHIERAMNRLTKHFPKATMADLTSGRLREHFEKGQVGHKTYNNRRGHVSTFLRYALERDWIAENPLMKIPARRVRRSRRGAATLTGGQAAEMMVFVEAHHTAAVPFFALCLFAGIRPCLRSGEILRLRPEHIQLDAGRIRIDGEVSKVREPRGITIQPNLAAWLRAYPVEQFPIIPTNLQHIREKVVEKFGLSHDIMRHTFISMFVAKFRSIGEAALQAGNSETIIRKHYLDLKTPEEAEIFWQIMPEKQPTRAVAPVVALPNAPTALALAG
jgi:integrase